MKAEINTRQENTAADLYKVNCEYCGGAGYVHPVENGRIQYDRTIPCICRKSESEKRIRRYLLDSCDLPPGTDDMDFKSFKVLPEVKTAFNIAKEMADKPGELRWITFMGVNGTGKTHLAISICKAWLNAGIPAKYAFVPLLLDELREGFNRQNGENYQKRFDYYCNVPLLILDDLGAESSTAWVQEKLETIVDYRMFHKLSLIITSNNALEQFSNRIRSRLPRLKESVIVNVGKEDFNLKAMP